MIKNSQEKLFKKNKNSLTRTKTKTENSVNNCFCRQVTFFPSLSCSWEYSSSRTLTLNECSFTQLPSLQRPKTLSPAPSCSRLQGRGYYWASGRFIAHSFPSFPASALLLSSMFSSHFLTGFLNLLKEVGWVKGVSTEKKERLTDSDNSMAIARGKEGVEGGRRW